LNNKEVLIKILLYLRKKGVNNEQVLLSVEKIPPHYFLNLLGNHNNSSNIDLEEIARLSKVLQDALYYKKKLSNVLITELKLGWFCLLSSLTAKRVYGLGIDAKKINDLEKVYKYLGLSNIFLKKSFNYCDWNKVAPFDLIIHLKSLKSVPTSFIEILSNDGSLFFTKENKKKSSIIRFNKSKKYQKVKIDEFFLSENTML